MIIIIYISVGIISTSSYQYLYYQFLPTYLTVPTYIII